MTRLPACFLVALSLTACAGTGTPPAGTATAPAGHKEAGHGGLGDDRLNATLWMQTSVEYQQTAAQAYRLAGLMLEPALSTPGSAAFEQADGGAGKPPAAIFDVDETVLDNSPYEVRMMRAGKPGFDPAVWDQWVSEKRARPIPGAVEFVAKLRAAGVRPIFVTNRACMERAGNPDPCPEKMETVENLRATGFGDVQPEDVLIRGDQGWPSEKAVRRQVVAERHRIVMMFGDQLTDFVSVPKKTPLAVRQAIADKAATLWGTRWFMIPNPMYGSWEEAVPDPKLDHLRAE